MPIERNAKKLPKTRSQIRSYSQLIRGEILTEVCYSWKGAPTTTNSAPMDTRVTDDKNFASREVAINIETQSQNRKTSQMVRGDIPTRVYYSCKGTSNESLSTPKDDLDAGDKNFSGSNRNRTDVIEDGENKVEFDNHGVHNTNTLNQTPKDYNHIGNYIHHKSKIKHGEGSGRGKVGNASNIQHGTTAT